MSLAEKVGLKQKAELKKRIDKEFNLAYNCCYDAFAEHFKDARGQAMVAGMINVGLKPNVNKILDEAIKEWKKIEAKVLEEEPWASGSYLIEKINEKRDEWFTRWYSPK